MAFIEKVIAKIFQFCFEFDSSSNFGVFWLFGSEKMCHFLAYWIQLLT